MNAIVIVALAVVCLFGEITADDPAVEVVFTGSRPGLLGCKPLPTSSLPGPKVRFQAVRSGGVEYSRVRVPSNRMTFSDVVATNLNSLNLRECADTATKKQWDAFSFVNGQCVGYKIGDGICPCTKGDFVLYLATGAIRSTSTAKAFTVNKERAAAAPLPAGYKRKIIYPIVSMTGDNFQSSDSSCEEVLADPKMTSVLLLHTANGRCYYTVAFSMYPCNSCAGTATEVIIKEQIVNPTYLLSKCNETIQSTKFYSMDDFKAGVPKEVVIYSHEGYGCIPYPDPASDNLCDITILAVPGAAGMGVGSERGHIDIDESAGNACAGDQLYVGGGAWDGSGCKKKSIFYDIILAGPPSVTIRFQRKPANNKNSVNKGFALFAFSGRPRNLSS